MERPAPSGAAGRWVRGLVAHALTATLLVAPASGQQWDPFEPRVSRADLEQRLDLYERAAESPAYTVELRAEAAAQARLIRGRLDGGDFRPGDRLLITVEQQPALTDTFSVDADQSIALPGVGEVELTGVLRSELRNHVLAAVARVIREPRVRTRSLVRVQVEGAVTAPGYYLLDSDLPLSDLLMRAGGQTAEARLEAARVERAGATLLTPERLQQALASGATVDHVGLRDGDRVVIPRTRTGWVAIARDLVYIIPAAAGFLAVLL